MSFIHLRLRGCRCLAAVAAAMTSLACSRDDGVSPERGIPIITDVAPVVNPWSTVSAVVTFRAAEADSARVNYESVDDASGATPFVAIRRGEGRITVLGLRAGTTYSLAVQAIGARATVQSEAVLTTTGELPDALRTLRLSVTGVPSAGYTLLVPIAAPTDADAHVVAVDASGVIRWYRTFAGESWAIDAKQQRNGNFTVYLGRSYGWQPARGRFVEVRPSGEEVRDYRSAAAYTDPHDLLFTYNPNDTSLAWVHLIGYESRRFDLRAIGGAPDALLGVHTIERQSASGTTVFSWNAADYFGPEDWPAFQAAPVDLVHPSSLDVDSDGHYIASFQAMDEITRIHSRTGELLWRFGGRHNQFTIKNDTRGGFQGQHSVRVLENGHLLLLDNQRHAVPTHARAVEYSLDTGARVARLEWEYAPDPPIASPIMGSVQRLIDGNTLIGFGAAGRIDEVNAAGRPVWRAVLTRGTASTGVPFYRAVRVASLYRYQRP